MWTWASHGTVIPIFVFGGRQEGNQWLAASEPNIGGDFQLALGAWNVFASAKRSGAGHQARSTSPGNAIGVLGPQPNLILPPWDGHVVGG